MLNCIKGLANKYSQISSGFNLAVLWHLPYQKRQVRVLSEMAAKIFLTLPSGQKMPALGLGTWQAKDEKELEVALESALKLGYRHIDTAWVYENEKIIGKILKKWLSSGLLKRGDLFITTKLPMVGVHPDRVEFFLNESLKNLQLNYVDLYLIHFPVGCKYQEGQVRPVLNEKGETATESKTDHVGVWKKLEQQVDKGLVKNIGLSNFNITQVQNILNFARIKPANLQVELHVYLQQRELVDFCQKNSVTVVAYSPLASPGYNKFLVQLGKEARQLPDILNDKVVINLADKYKKSPAQIALRFLVERNICPIPKSVTPKRLDENINIFDFELTQDDMKQLYSLEFGEPARVCDFKLFKGLNTHPDWPGFNAVPDQCSIGK